MFCLLHADLVDFISVFVFVFMGGGTEASIFNLRSLRKEVCHMSSNVILF